MTRRGSPSPASKTGKIVYDNKIYLEGKVTDASAITAFSIAGESYWKHKCQQLFFGYFALLRAGQMNGFLLEAADEWGNRGERAVRVMHQVQQTRQLGARLRVLLAAICQDWSAFCPGRDGVCQSVRCPGGTEAL